MAQSDTMHNLEQRIAMKVAGEDVNEIEKRGVMTKKIPTFALTAGELRAACQTEHAKDHPCTPVFMKATMGLPDDYKVVVELPDLQALLTGKFVVMETERVLGKDPVITKRLVDERPGETAPPIVPAKEQSVDPTNDLPANIAVGATGNDTVGGGTSPDTPSTPSTPPPSSTPEAMTTPKKKKTTKLDD